MRIDLKKVSIHDIEKIRNWRNSDLIRNVSYNQDYITAEMQETWFKNIQQTENQLHWIILINEVEAGYAAIKNVDLQNLRCEFASLYIGEPDFLLNGVGALLEYRIIDYLYNAYPTLNKIYCEVLEFNKKVIQLHKRFGFVIEGELRQHYFINNGFKNVVLLALFKDKWLEAKVGISRILKV